MLDVNSFDELTDLLVQSKASLVLFGGENCGVCTAIKPRLEKLLNSAYPELRLLYVDCQRSQDICAQNSVFSLPVVRVFFEGQLFLEEIKAFSINKLVTDIERPYRALFLDV